MDTRLGFLDTETVRAQAREFAPDIIGLSSLIIEAGRMHTHAAALREDFPGVPIVAGGPYASASPERVLRDPAVTCAIPGEGEQTLAALAECVDAGRDFADLPGLVFAQNGGVRRNAPRPYIEDLDTMPFPDWDAVDLPAYALTRRFCSRRPAPYMPVFSSRSCPYNCIYCHNIFGKSFRSRSAGNVFEEIRTVHDRYGIRQFEIIDDCFNLDRIRALDVCERISNSGMKLQLMFPNGLRADRLDHDLLVALRAAGTVMICVAIESASPRLQKYMRKNLDLARAREVIRDITRLGIFCQGFFMLGFPTETEQEMRDTIRYACRSRLHTASFFAVKPVPGTELHSRVYGPDSAFSEDEFKVYGYHNVNCKCSTLSPDKFRALFVLAFYRFYLNPLRAIRVFTRFPDRAFLLKGFAHLFTRLNLPLRGHAAHSPAYERRAGESENDGRRSW